MPPPRQRAVPTVSVVICAYSPERLDVLGEAIASLGSQTTAPHEVFLVIDHAPDLLETARSRWQDIRVIPSAGPQGLSGGRNTGIETSSGEVVAFLDDDAIASLDWVERLGAAYADPDVVGVGGFIQPRWVTGRPKWFPPEFEWIVGCTHSGMPRKPEPVRNLVGANMSFRRSVLIEVGSFRHQLSRIGKHPIGGDETDLCIRVGDRWPKASILYDPEVSVEHLVPADRSTVAYYHTRCAAEGRSKAVLAGLVGTTAGLDSERAYVRRTLPLGFLKGIRETASGDLSGLGRSAMIAFGLLTTTAGYAAGRVPARRAVEQVTEPPPERMEILMVTPRSPLGEGGVERHVIEVGRRLAAAGDRVEVISAEPGGPPITRDEVDGVAVSSVRAWPANRDWYLAPGIWPQMSRRHWDVIHVQSYHTAVAPLAMLRALWLGIPYVVTFHGGGHSSGFRNRIRRAQRRILRPLLSRAARLIAVARFEIDLYSEELRLPRERFAWIPNGTELSFDPDGAEAGAATPGLIATIGRLERYKGHHRVIEAMPGVIAGRPDARLLVVGSGPYEDELRRRAAELGLGDRVEFVSIPPEDRTGMARLLRSLSLVVLLSEFESHPLVALEAAAAGRPLLVADEGGLAELVAQKAARPVALDAAPETVAEAIVEELESPTESEPLHLTSWDECAAELRDLYREVA